jgi:sporulation protein YlmC with PRC-barrel domain
MQSVSRGLAVAALAFALPGACLAQDASTPSGTIPGSPNLAVATVKMENGYRASKLIGAAVFNDQNQQIGSIDDLILNKGEKAVLAVLQVGGFLGVGGKLVAVPYAQLRVDDKGKVLLPEASKDDLNTKPNFTY